ncbi:hypothetical protein FBU59_000415 [Linderina macrospora]|uniref:Uncharacterized protein n=1 Tax=Linderina macrospora TaxID=4868 RepID=A0ACC1JGX9_9FUNG|nr:hypothetical protein FBU59_000415 [Linderina macrospora]
MNSQRVFSKCIKQASQYSARHYSTPATSGKWQPISVYTGSLSKAARVMKMASVASLVGASAAVPFFFGGDSDVPQTARTILAITTMSMTGTSTAIVTWALKPYIVNMSILQNGEADIGPDTPLLVETMTFLGQPLTRLVFPHQLEPATKPLTSWVSREPTENGKQLAQEILKEINLGRKKDLVQLAQAGDAFYAHTQGQISKKMREIVSASPCQE